MNPVLIKVIKRCQQDPAWFINTFCKVKHPKLGIIPFKLFKYQRKCLKDFLNNKYNIFRKCRQVGASTLTGGFALWYAMFFNNKSILIVSRTDPDAKNYLSRNIKFVYKHLPDWMKELWPPEVYNEHTLSFRNGSSIRSLTSNPDTLRSNASSLNIIDEAAFIMHMDDMWKAGYSTLQTGGSCIIISTPRGVSSWYYKTWKAAIDKENEFNPILINWWDMDWTLDFVDELSGERTIISPTKGIKKLETESDIEKYGPYWSPWLEQQYGDLATKGDDSAFRQEVLAEFLGSGSTVLGRKALITVDKMVEDHGEPFTIVDSLEYVNPTLDENLALNFNELLWIWKKPYTKKDAEEAIQKAKRDNTYDQLPEHDKRPHLYVIGADASTGEANDFCGLEIFDIDAKEQVAELRIRVIPKHFARMADYLGRLYNNALIVPERTGIGVSLCQELEYELMYPVLYRHKQQTSTLKMKYNKTGYPTSNSTKHTLVKTLKDYIGPDGWLIRSRRLYQEMCIFIHLGNGKYGNEPGTGNTDDLVIATALALVGISEAMLMQGHNLYPIQDSGYAPDIELPAVITKREETIMKMGGKHALPPFLITSEGWTGKASKEQDLAKFTSQLGGVSIKNKKAPKDSVAYKKHILKYYK